MQNESSLEFQDEFLTMKENLGLETASPVVFPPYVDVAVGFMIDALVRFAVSGMSDFAGRALRINFEKSAFDVQEVLKIPRCPACNNPLSRHLFL